MEPYLYTKILSYYPKYRMKYDKIINHLKYNKIFIEFFLISKNCKNEFLISSYILFRMKIINLFKKFDYNYITKHFFDLKISKFYSEFLKKHQEFGKNYSNLYNLIEDLNICF
jgi:hypothetical protein